MTSSILNQAYLLLGSNIDSEANLPAAVRALESFGKIAAVSRVWESEPVGFAEQANFLNAAVLLETELSAAELREGPIVDVERQLRRLRDPKNVDGPRTIDVDVVLFNDDIGTFGRVRVPDPGIGTQAFATIPLAEIAPDYVHPETGRTLAESAAMLKDGTQSLILRPDVQIDVGTPDSSQESPATGS